MKIGNIVIKNNFFLAPLAGVTDVTYRILCKEMGAGLVTTEMISAKGLYYNDLKTIGLIEISDEERPTAVQIFGSDPEIMANVVENKLNNNDKIDIIDINMGCPASKIVKNGDGSALMKNPELVKWILDAVVSKSKKPITIKIRKGWDEESINGVEIAKIADDMGVSAITIHGRTKDMLYSGKADWDIIKEIKQSVSIPVIGNGDVFNANDAIEMMNYTGCDGVAIGRGAMGNPWIFRDILSLEENNEVAKIELSEIIDMCLRHYEMLIKNKGERTAVREMRKNVAWYIKGRRNSAFIKNKVNKMNDINEIIQLLKEYSVEELSNS